MNSFFQKAIALFSLAVPFGLLSCQNSSLITPERPALNPTPTVQNLDGGISAGSPKKYTLTTHGQGTLTYLGDGRLHKVSYKPGTYLYNYTNYTYGSLQIKTTSYSGYQVGEENTYFTDANTGRCYESNEKSYVFYSFGTVMNEQNWVYTYNATGQLTSRAKKSNILARTAYTYNATGDLSKTTTYGANGIATSEATFTYALSAADPLLTDHHPLNNRYADLPNPYLRIFGKSSKHLVKRITEKSLPGNQVQYDFSFTYTLNADGYVTEQKMLNTNNNALLDTTPYGYLVTNIMFMP